MSAIINFSIKKDKLTFNDKGYANVTMFLDDETNQWGQNAAVIMSQNKEQREAKEARTYIGNGRVAYVSDSGVVVGEKVDQGVTAENQSTAGRETPDLPF